MRAINDGEYLYRTWKKGIITRKKSANENKRYTKLVYTVQLLSTKWREWENIHQSAALTSKVTRLQDINYDNTIPTEWDRELHTIFQYGHLQLK